MGNKTDIIKTYVKCRWCGVENWMEMMRLESTGKSNFIGRNSL